MYHSIDLFAGIGGIRLGFEQAFEAEIDTVFVSEINRQAYQTYQANFGATALYAPDITQVDAAEIPAHDILLAGFPCQAFSMAGKRHGFADTRGTLFFDVARIVQQHRPRVVFCENVKNLATHDKKRTLKVIIATLEELGYKVFTQVLNSKDFGVPQNRARIYIVAFRNDIAPENFDFPQGIDSPSKIADIIEKHPVPSKYYLSQTYLESLIRHKERHASKGHGFGYVVRELDGISGTVVCGGMGRERNLIIDPRLTDFTPTTNIKGEINSQYIRKMTPREWARLQGFPD